MEPNGPADEQSIKTIEGPGWMPLYEGPYLRVHEISDDVIESDRLSTVEVEIRPVEKARS